MSGIRATSISKRYTYRWVLKGISCNFPSDRVSGIAGNNGSGKSTLIKILSGYLSPSDGSVEYHVNGSVIRTEQVFEYVALAAPYTDVVNEFTLREMFRFHSKFRPFRENLSFQQFEEKIRLAGHDDKPLSHFSSGMKQKTQLALALLSDTPFLLLDEPSSFLDENARQWFVDLLHDNKKGRVVVIASNDPSDLALCSEVIRL